MIRLYLFVVVTAITLAGCVNEKEETGKSAAGAAVPTVYSVNYPLTYFADRIGGTAFDVIFPVPEGVDPAFWKPTSDVIHGFQQADLILLNGAGYAKWIAMASLPENQMLNTTEAIRDHYIEIETHVTHAHGPEGDHAHGGVAFTTWLDFTLARLQAAAVRDGLAVLASLTGIIMDASNFQAQYTALDNDLLNLDQQMQDIAARLQGRALLASHPVYQYLAAGYKLEIHSVMLEPDSEPTPQQWYELDKLRVAHTAKIMLWEAEPLPKVKKHLESLGIQVVVFDQCANRPGDGKDFLSVMRNNIEMLRSASR